MAGVLGVTPHHAEHAAPPMTTGPLTLTCTDAELDTLWPHALSLSLVTGRAFCLVGPEGAEPPKLKAAHLALGRAAAALAGVDAPAVACFPASGEGRAARACDLRLDVGAAMSTGAVLTSLQPGLALAGGGRLELLGATHHPGGPLSQALARVWPVILGAFGLGCEVHLERAGFAPAGQGVLSAQIHPRRGHGPDTVELLQRGTLHEVRVTSMVAGPQGARALAQSRGAESALREAGVSPELETLSLPSAHPRGGAVLIVAQFEHTLATFSAVAGTQEAPEETGQRAARAFETFLAGPGSVDGQTAQQLMLWGALLAAGHLGPSNPARTRFQAPGADASLLGLARVLRAFLPISVTTGPDGSCTVQPF